MKAILSLSTFAALAVMPNALAEQSLVVECGLSIGQICPNAAAFTVDAPGDAPVSVNLKTPASHCSAVRYTVVPAFGSKISTSFLDVGQSQIVQLGRLAKGTHAFLITATGKVGGCNQGRLASWGVKVNP